MPLPEIGADDFRVANDVCRLALRQNLAEIEHDGAINQRHYDLHYVLDHQDRHAGGAHLAHQFNAPLRLDRSETREHLVEQ